MRSRHLSPALGLIATVIVTSFMAACSSPKSFFVLNLVSATPTPIVGVTEVVVDVSQGPSFTKRLTYPPPAGKDSLTIDMVTVTSLSVSFSGGRSGPVGMVVSLMNADGCRVGVSTATLNIVMGSVFSAKIPVDADHTCDFVDGGLPDGSSSEVFPGCDPVTPQCGAGKTCQVNCGTHKGECITGGLGAPGTPCTKNDNCMPGTQCFDYAGSGCNVKLCLRFCNDDNGCHASGGTDGGAADGGADGGGTVSGTRSLCAGPVQCGGVTTGYHTCTFACDPRQVATTFSGCPTGLACLVVGNMDQVDCACAEPTRTGTDGADCTTSAQCAPGYICNMMGGAQKCRAVCRCDAKDMLCTAPNDCGGGRTCSALTNDTIFGACL